MASDTWQKALWLLALCALSIGCGAPTLRRFPEGRAVVWRDDDARPFHATCRPDPEKPGHALCAPQTYVSPFAWDAVDNSLFAPMTGTLAVSAAREAVNVNSLDEVPDSSWFENRLSRHALTSEAIAHGPCADGKVLQPSSGERTWLIDQGKPNGANPGFRVRAEGAGKFMLKADIQTEPERATAAAAVAARLLWAAGYFTPCDSVVYLHSSVLRLKPGLKFADNSGVERAFDEAKLTEILGRAAKRGELVRMSASRWLPGRAIGPFTYSGTRQDDPNDAIAHERRRELRGLRLFSAWLNHFDAREQNSMNTWMAVDSSDPDSTPGYVRHWLLDFGDCFGSQWDWDGISRRLGHAYYLDLGYAGEDFLTLGAIERPWDRAERSREAPLFAYFASKDFDPERWRPGYRNPAFAEMTERDGAWAARIIARFTVADLRAVVATADLSKPAHTEYLVRTLRERQLAILRRYLSRLSPLGDVHTARDKVCAVDLAQRSGAFAESAFQYSARLYVPGREPAELRVQRGAAGEVCARLGEVASDFAVLDLYNGLAPAPLRAHVYLREAPTVAGLERPENADPPNL